ncbi:hypothetical protein BGX30_007394, partial [Mortierella sp. GBA39]
RLISRVLSVLQLMTRFGRVSTPSFPSAPSQNQKSASNTLQPARIILLIFRKQNPHRNAAFTVTSSGGRARA